MQTYQASIIYKAGSSYTHRAAVQATSPEEAAKAVIAAAKKGPFEPNPNDPAAVRYVILTTGDDTSFQAMFVDPSANWAVTRPR